MADREPGSAPAADPNWQPQLFGVLPNTLFTVFSRGSRVEYAQLILDLWRAFYADPLVDQPSRKELAAFIDDRIRFIYRGDHGCMRAAETILGNRAYFENLMLATGRRLMVDARIGMVGTVPLDVPGR